MKKNILLLLFFLSFSTLLFAQNEEGEEKKGGFKKENLFTGGGISLGLGFGSSGNAFSIGVSPVIGYSITKWLDAGIVINYGYASYNYEDALGYKARITNYGGGVFTKVYPIRFIYVQAQFEHNFIYQKYIYNNGGPTYTDRYDGNSFLLGAGYASSRDPENKVPFFYIGLMADVSGDRNSPYVDANGSAVPLIWTGFQIPLFQGKRKGNYDAY